MNDVDEYLATLSGPELAELKRLDALVRAQVPNVAQGRSYDMPCYLYRGKGVASILVTKKHLAWYPYSGRTLATLTGMFDGYSQSTGTLRFQLDQPLSDEMVSALLSTRMREIDEKLDGR